MPTARLADPNTATARPRWHVPHAVYASFSRHTLCLRSAFDLITLCLRDKYL